MAKLLRVYDDESWKLVNSISVFDNSTWKNVNVGWVYEPAALTMTGWTVFFGTLTPSVSITSFTTTETSITLNWDSEYQEYISILYWRTDNPSQTYTTGNIYTQLETYTISNSPSTPISPGEYFIFLSVYSETDTGAFDSETIVIPIVPLVSNFQLYEETSTTASFTWYSKNQREYRIVASYDFGDGSLAKDTGWIITTNNDGQTGGTLGGLDAGTEYYDTTLYVKSITGATASTTLIPDGRFTTQGPTNIVAPVNSGDVFVGGQRSVTSGTWEGATGFYYQWVRSLTPSGEGTNIPGAEGPSYTSYTLTNSDAGYYIACKVSPRIPYFPNIIAYSNWSPLIGRIPTATLHSIDQITSSSARYNFSSTDAVTIYARATDDFSGENIDSPSPISSPYTLTGLNSNRTYSGFIIASNNFGLINSNGISFTTQLPLPPAPTGLQAFVQGQNQVYLDWNDVIGFDLSTPYYRIQYSTNASTWTTLNGTASSNFTVTGLSAGTLYYFRVAAVNASGTGPYSASVTAVTSPPAPGAFTLSVSNVGQTSATFSWTPSSFATSYTLFYYFNDFDQGTIYDITSTSYNVTGLTGGRTYTGQVAAVNSTSVTNSNVVSFTTTAPPPPAPSINFFSVGQSDFFVTASWSVSNATSYTIAVSYFGTTTYSTTSTSYTWSKGEDIGTGLHTFTLTASGPGGSASSSTSLNITAPPSASPSFPFFPFFPYFPYFPPYFPPFFPPEFPPFAPPVFPFFPPRFPFFTATSEFSNNSLQRIRRPLFLTEEYGQLEDRYLSEEDLLIKMDIDKLNKQNTKILSITSIKDSIDTIFINNEPYNAKYKLLVQKNNINQFVRADQIDYSYKLFDYNSNCFINISEIINESYQDEVYYVETEHPIVINSTVGFADGMDNA